MPQLDLYEEESGEFICKIKASESTCDAIFERGFRAILEDQISQEDCMYKIERVIYNNPATIILWVDGDKTIVKTMENDVYQPEVGFAMAYMKKMFGSRHQFEKFVNKWKPAAKEVSETELTYELSELTYELSELGKEKLELMDGLMGAMGYERKIDEPIGINNDDKTIVETMENDDEPIGIEVLEINDDKTIVETMENDDEPIEALKVDVDREATDSMMKHMGVYDSEELKELRAKRPLYPEIDMI